MRTVTQTVADAIELKPSYRVTARLTAYKSRVFFKETDWSDFGPSFARPEYDKENPLPEAAAYNATISKLVTVTVDRDGTLYLLREGNATPINPGSITADPNSRPGIWGDYIYYFDNTNWKRTHINMSAFNSGNPNCVIGTTAFYSNALPGAIYPLSFSEAVLFQIYEGSIRVVYHTVGVGTSIAPGRIFNPTLALKSTDADHPFLTHYSGACKVGDTVCAYFSQYDGSVVGIRLLNNTWTDYFTAVPQDLSKFLIGTVLANDGNVYMVGTFQRTEDFASNVRYTLCLKSIDQTAFSIDRKTLVTTEGYRFLAGFDGTNIYYSSTNRYYKTVAPYQLIGESTTSTIVEMLSLSGSTGNGWTAQAAVGAELYFDDVLLDTGVFAKLEIGIYDGLTPTYIKYHDVVIASINKGFADGQKQMELQLVTDAMWHTSMMSHPFYMQVLGKSGIFDPVQKFSNLYKLDDLGGKPWSLTADFWTIEGHSGGYGAHLAGQYNDHWSMDLLQTMADYPEFGEDPTYAIRLYGWSRAGKPDTNPNTPDNTTLTADNDDFYGLIEVEDPTGNISTIVTTVAQLTSTYKHPEQTYFAEGVRAGSYPVIYQVDSPGAGYKIHRVGIRVQATADGPTVYAAERVEMPGITAKFLNLSAEQTFGWSLQQPQVRWGLVETIPLQITTGNSADGDLVTMTYTPKDGYAYAVVVIGQVGFTRNGYKYLQDANYYCNAPVGQTIPTWDRSYPPGNEPTPRSAVSIEAGEWPYYTAEIHTWDEAVKDIGVSKKHEYVFHANDPRLESSAIPRDYIPFVPSTGRKFDISFNLAGSGAISGITDGAFTVLVFESSIALDEFYAFGGVNNETDRFFFVTQNDFGQSFNPSTHYQTYLADDTEAELRAANLYQPRSLKIKAPSGKSVTLRVKTDYYVTSKRGDDADLLTDLWARGDLDAGGGIAFLYQDQIPGRARGSDLLTLQPGQTLEIALNHQGTSADATMVVDNRSISVNVVSAGPVNPQVPMPPAMNLKIPAVDETNAHTLANETERPAVQDTKGLPMILLSTQPYSAWNFEVTGRFLAKGIYSNFGLIGLANDGDNYLVGYARNDTLYIAKVRGGAKTILASYVVSWLEPNKVYDLRFWHRDGLLGLEVKKAQEFWPARESQLTYTWTEDDEAIAPKDDVFHVGVYSYIDPPKFRIVAHLSQSKQLGIMPGDYDPTTGTSDFITFPKTGQVEIDKIIYGYAGKIGLVSLKGPYDLRNVTEWKPPYSTGFQGGKAIELLDFYWWDGTHTEDFTNKIMASADGDAWLNDQTQWQVWIRTGGQKVWLRNRSRWYSEKLPDYLNTGFNKVYVTKGLNNMALADTKMGKKSHDHGTFCYLHTEDVINLYGFSAFNGEHDLTIAGLIQQFSRVAGTDANLLGDSIQINSSEEVTHFARGATAFQTQIAGSVLLSQVHNLIVQDGTQAQTAGNAILQLPIIPVIQNAAQAQSMANVTLLVTNSIAPANAAQPQVAGNVVLIQQHGLTIGNASQPQSSENMALAQQATLTIQNMAQAQTAGNVELILAGSVIIESMAQPQSAQGITLTQVHNLAANNQSQPQTAENIILSVNSTLAISTAAQPQNAENTSLLLADQLLPPVADTTDGNWTNQGGSGTNMYASIDDTDNDADYIQSEIGPASSPVVVRLQGGTDPRLSTRHRLTYRYAKQGGIQVINLTVQLRQGYVSEGNMGTLIAQWVHNISDYSFSTITQTLTQAQADSITNYADLYLRFVAG